MKYLQLLLFGLLTSFLMVQPSGAVMQVKGTDQKLEWGVIRQFKLDQNPLDIAHSLDGRYAFVLTKNSVVQVYDAKGNLQGTIPVDEGVNTIALDPYGKHLHLSDSLHNTYSTLSIDFVASINLSNAPIKGKPDAPITIAVYSDYQ